MLYHNGVINIWGVMGGLILAGGACSARETPSEDSGFTNSSHVCVIHRDTLHRDTHKPGFSAYNGKYPTLEIVSGARFPPSSGSDVQGIPFLEIPSESERWCLV